MLTTILNSPQKLPIVGLTKKGPFYGLVPQTNPTDLLHELHSSRIKIRNKDFTFWLSNGLLANVTDLGLGSGVS